jgi:hypothetical protein
MPSNTHVGRTPVATPVKQEAPEQSPAHTTNELVKLIRKLRWMGMDDEAQGLQNELEQRHATAADSVLATPHETD